MLTMKRLQIMIDEDLDAALGRQAAEEGTSKAALIRRFVRDAIQPGMPPIEDDPLWQMVGQIDDPAYVHVHHDDVVYPR